MRKSIVCFLVVTLSLSSCTNVLSEMGNANSDEALLFDAQEAVDKKRYQSAIDIVTQRVSPAGQQSVKAKEVLASGYAGRCGLNFIDYTQKLITPSPDADPNRVFSLLSDPFIQNQNIHPDSCVLALQTIGSIGPLLQRTNGQNTRAAIVGMVLVGIATRLYTDNVPVGGDRTTDFLGTVPVDIDGNGTIVNFEDSSACHMTDPQIDQIILGFAYMAENFNYIASQIGGSVTTIGSAIDLCDNLGVTCFSTDPAAIDNNMRMAMKAIMNTADYGVGVAAAADFPRGCPP